MRRALVAVVGVLLAGCHPGANTADAGVPDAGCTMAGDVPLEASCCDNLTTEKRGSGGFSVATCCAITGQPCSAATDCCSAYHGNGSVSVACTMGKCCNPARTSCLFGTDCCSGNCVEGVCGMPIDMAVQPDLSPLPDLSTPPDMCGLPLGWSCTLDSQCCNRWCGETTSQTCCQPIGLACTVDGDCCPNVQSKRPGAAGNCIAGVCQSCQALAEECDLDADCCGWNGQGGGNWCNPKVGLGSCVACSGLGGPCITSLHCCGYYVCGANSACTTAPVPYACGANSDCTSGACGTADPVNHHCCIPTGQVTTWPADNTNGYCCNGAPVQSGPNAVCP